MSKAEQQQRTISEQNLSRIPDAWTPGASPSALNARIADVYSAFRAGGKPMTIAHVQDALGWRHAPVWETEQLLARGALRRVANTPGVDCVDGRYEALPSREWRL